MGRGREIFAHLEAAYPLVETREYGGSLEPVMLSLFALSGREPTPAHTIGR